MKRNSKRFLSLLLSLAMIFTLVGTPVYADDTEGEGTAVTEEIEETASGSSLQVSSDGTEAAAEETSEEAEAEETTASEPALSISENSGLLLTASNGTAWDGTIAEEFDGGTGTSADPYRIATGAQLAYLAQQVNAGTTYNGSYFTLTDDIDLGSQQWTPIGTSTYSFQGYFDGGGYTISNLYAVYGTTTSGKSNVGLFGYTKSGSVSNFTIDNAQVSGYLNVGVIAGCPYTSTYSDITVTGTIKVDGYAYVGGAFGKNVYADITNIDVLGDSDSYVNAKSEGYRTYVGGLVGFMGEGNHTVSYCDVVIDVTGSTCDVGGLLGILHYGNTLSNCTYSGTVTLTSTAEDESDEVGGLVGTIHTSASNTIENCTFTGKIVVEDVDVTETASAYGAYYSDSFGSSYVFVAENVSYNGVDVSTTSAAAAIGSTYYATLALAFDAAVNGDTVTLLNDVTLNAPLVYDKSDVSVTLELNGNTITFAYSDGKYNGETLTDGAWGLKVSSGELTIQDSSEEETGGIVTADKDTYVDPVGASNDATLNIMGGYYYTNSIYEAVVFATSTATVNISGGTFENAAKSYAYNSTYTEGVVLNIGNSSTAVISVTGGTFIGRSPAEGDDNNTESGSTFVADGYEATGSDGNYTVASETYVATVTDSSSNVTSYTTLAAAAEYANSLVANGTTCTIKLLSDITLTETVTLKNTNSAASKKLTLDLDEHTVTSDVENGYALYLGTSGTYGLVIVKNGTINATENAYGAIEIDNEAVQLSSLTLTSQTSGHGTILIDSVCGTSSNNKFTDITINTTDGYCLEVSDSNSSSNAVTLSGTLNFTQTESDSPAEDQLNACIYLGGYSMSLGASSATANLSSPGYGVYIKGNSRFTGPSKGTVSGETKAVYIDSSYSYTYSGFTVSSSSTAKYNGGIASDASTETYSNGAVSISGGTYDEEVNSSYVASGYVCEYDSASGRYVINEDVIAILYDASGEVKGSYNSLSAALKAAAKTTGYTVVLQKDYSTSSEIALINSTYGTSDITIDLNGHTYTYTGTSTYAISFNAKSTTLTITDSSEEGGGKIVSTSETSSSFAVTLYQGTLNVTGKAEISGTYGAIQMGGTSSAYSSTVPCVLNVDDDAVISGGTVGITIWGSSSSSTSDSDGPVLTVSGGTVTGGNYGISGNGSTNYYGSTTINIKGGTVSGAAGIYHPQVGTVNVSDGTVTGDETGIEMRAGELNVSGGTISSTSETASYVANGNGTTVIGAGIAVSQHSTNNEITVTVTGGEISGYYGIYEVNTYAGTNSSDVTITVSEGSTSYIVGTVSDAVYSESLSGETTAASDNTTVTLSGGQYSSDVSEYCTEGYSAAVTTYDNDGNAVYTIVNGVAAVYDAEGTYISTYASLSDAYTAVKNYSGGTICLISDITGEKIKVTSDLSFTLDLNGYTYDSGSNVAVLVQSSGASVTIKDSGENGTITSSCTTAVIYSTAGTITIESGTITSTATSTYLIRTGGSDAAITVNDGTFSSTCVLRVDSGDVVVNGGTFTGSSNIVYDVSDTGSLIINDGWFSSDSAFRTSGDAITVNGGYFTETDTNYSRLKNYIPTGYSVVTATDEDGIEWYTIGKSNFTVEYVDDETGETVVRSSHTTLAAAVSAAQNGDTVVMNDNSDSGFKLNDSSKSITLDLNGYTISVDDADSYVIGVVSGSLTIIDSSEEGTGTITGTISESSSSSISGIVRNMGGTLTIESGTISVVDGNAVNAYDGTTTITGGNFEGGLSTNSTLTISGGYFSENPSEYTADGCSAYEYTVDPYEYEVTETRVAKIGDTYYTTIAAAVEAAQSDDTITLLTDVSESTVTLDKSVILDLNEYTLTTNYIYVSSSDVDATVTNGNITGKYGVYLTDGKLTLDSCEVTLSDAVHCYGGELILTSSKVTSSGNITIDNYDSSTVTIGSDSEVINTAEGGHGVVIWGDGSGATAKTPTLNVYGTITAAICVQGNGSDYSGTIINIYDGAILTASTLGMYLPQPCTVNITGGTITGVNGAIGIKSGTLNISGNANISATGEYDADLTSTTNGINTDGSAIIIDSYAGYAGNIELNIFADADGNTPTISSTNSYAIREISNSASTNVVKINISAGTIIGGSSVDSVAISVTEAAESTIFISGGYFSSQVEAEYCAEGYVPSEKLTDGDYEGYYTVTTGTYLGISSDATTTVPATIVSGEGTSTMYALVTSDNIGNYSTANYPTTSLTTDDGHSYIFAGWYSAADENYAMESFPTGDAYAKFVDADILGVKCVVSETTSGAIRWRFITSFDTIYYYDVGFYEITKDGEDVTSDLSNVNLCTGYFTVTSIDDGLTTNATDFSTISKYIATAYYDNTDTEGTFTATPYWLTGDGTTVKGTTVIFTYSGNYGYANAK